MFFFDQEIYHPFIFCKKYIILLLGDGQLVMKSGAWKMGDQVTCTLVNKDEEEIASRETTWNKDVQGSSS